MPVRPLASCALPLAICTIACADAAETAQYRVTFDAVWSVQTHPTDFPGGAHWSPIIGGTHALPGLFWDAGAFATPGIEQMAETGATTLLRNEVNQQRAVGNAGVVIQASGGMNSPGTSSVTFMASQTNPLATVVSMIAPSPDWFVGTHGVVLFDGDHWRPEVTVDLLPYDAGTDSGVAYTSANLDTQPPAPIEMILGYPFAADGMTAPSLGTMTFTRIDAPPCPADTDGSGDVTFTDVVAALAAWGPCAACPQDIDMDGTVGFTDLLATLSAFGPCD